METGTIIIVTLGTVVAAGVAIGLYRLGKKVQRGEYQSPLDKIKVSGENWSDLESKLEKGYTNSSDKETVAFERVPNFSFENLAEWINQTDIPDADGEKENLGCYIIRGKEGVKDFKLNLKTLSEADVDKIFAAHIVNLDTKKVYKSRWMIVDKLDQDLIDLFGDKYNIVVQ
jgi:hypothetical protein